jgi:hypothetical protein
MSERPHQPEPADTQMFRAFVARGEEETPSRRWVLPVTLLVVLAVVLVVVLLIVF